MTEQKNKYLNKHAVLYPNGKIEKGLSREQLADLKKFGIPEGSIIFDSKMELDYYVEQLLPLVQTKKIKVEIQPKYILLDAFTKNGVKYQPITYSPDFRVTVISGILKGRVTCYDVKGFENDRFPLKRKMFDARYKEELIVMKRVLKYGGWITDKQYKDFKKAKEVKVNADVSSALSWEANW